MHRARLAPLPPTGGLAPGERVLCSGSHESAAQRGQRGPGQPSSTSQRKEGTQEEGARLQHGSCHPPLTPATAGTSRVLLSTGPTWRTVRIRSWPRGDE